MTWRSDSHCGHRRVMGCGSISYSHPLGWKVPAGGEQHKTLKMGMLTYHRSYHIKERMPRRMGNLRPADWHAENSADRMPSNFGPRHGETRGRSVNLNMRASRLLSEMFIQCTGQYLGRLWAVAASSRSDDMRESKMRAGWAEGLSRHVPNCRMLSVARVEICELMELALSTRCDWSVGAV